MTPLQTSPVHDRATSLRIPVSISQNRTGANTFHDLQVRWNAPWNGTFSVGANNLFSHEGPILYSAPNSQFLGYGGFDIGRFYYVRYNQNF